MPNLARMLGGLAVLGCALGAAAPARADDFYGITPDDKLVRFTALDHALRNAIPLKGLASGEHVVTIDARPATGGLYGIALKGTAIRVVRIDQATGALTAIGAGVGMPSPSVGVGMDFNPGDDTIVVVSDNDQAVRFDPVTGAPTLLPGPNPASAQIVALAYTPDDGSFSFAFSIDRATDKLMLGSGSGLLADIFGPLGFDVTNNVSLDMDDNAQLWMYVPSPSRMYHVETGSGEANEAGTISPLLAVALVLTGPIRFGAPAFAASEGDGSATVTLHRDAPADESASVRWSTTTGTATAGADFTASSGTVTFGRGQSSATVTVPLRQDSAAEGTERVALHLTSVDGVPAGPDAQLVIADDDTAPGGGPGGTPDTTAPVLLALPVKVAARRTVKLRFGVSEAGPVSVTLKLKAKTAKRLKLPATLGTATLQAKAGENTARLKLSRKAARKLHARSATKATAAIVAADAAGNRAARDMKVTLT